MKKFFIVNIFLSISFFAALAQSPVEIFTKNAQLAHANISILVKDANTGKVLCEHRAAQAATPASTMKLVTTATALELFGADFRFKTTLAYDGQIGMDSVLHGNLYVIGSGDPTLGSAKLGEPNFLDVWVAKIRAAGIKTIDGQILADEAIFDAQAANPRWTWEDMGNAYAPGIHGISYIDNTLRVVFKSGAVGTTPEILRTEPQIDGITFSNYLKSTSVTYDKGYFYGEPFSNHRTIYGDIPANRAEFAVKSDLPHPAEILVLNLRQKLVNQDFKIKNEILPASERKIFYTHFSPFLSEIITETNTKSNNHYAEYLFRVIGTRAGMPATIDGSIKTVRDFWQARGLSVAGLFMADGSGLSPANAVSAEFFVSLLEYMRGKSRNYAAFYASLAVAGESGTLEPLLRKSPLKGKIHAKSGTLTRVKSYAGYIDYKDKSLIFTVIVNNFNNSSYDVIKLVEEFLTKISE